MNFLRWLRVEVKRDPVVQLCVLTIVAVLAMMFHLLVVMKLVCWVSMLEGDAWRCG